MGIVMVHKDGFDFPMIRCDHCQEVIENAADGNYQWDDMEESESPVVYFTHKECCHPFDSERPGMGAMDLDVLPVYLTNNLKIDWTEAQARSFLLAGNSPTSFIRRRSS